MPFSLRNQKENTVKIMLPLTSHKPLVRLLIACLLFSLSIAVGLGQTKSNYDGSTPSGLTPGAPAGSYALSGFDNINLYNGSLNFHLPLIQIGGRGVAGFTSNLTIEQL